MGRRVDEKFYEAVRPSSLAERIFLRARKMLYDDFIRICCPDCCDTILDVGVSDVIGIADNIVERSYPHPHKITAVGLGSGEGFVRAFPKVTYKQIGANERIPFDSGEFDIVVANAVLEHVGSFENQLKFVRELKRLGKRVYLTVPNRFFPVEHHTAIPFLHWTDSSFSWACSVTGKGKWAKTDNLILMSAARLRRVCPDEVRYEIGKTGLKFGPFSSNLYLFLTT